MNIYIIYIQLGKTRYVWIIWLLTKNTGKLLVYEWYFCYNAKTSTRVPSRLRGPAISFSLWGFGCHCPQPALRWCSHVTMGPADGGSLEGSPLTHRNPVQLGLGLALCLRGLPLPGLPPRTSDPPHSYWPPPGPLDCSSGQVVSCDCQHNTNCY